jgi:hypothetical protein
MTGTDVLDSADGETSQRAKRTEQAIGTHELESTERRKPGYRIKPDRKVGRLRNKNLEEKMSQD